MPSKVSGEVKDHASERKSMKACTQDAEEQIELVVDEAEKELDGYAYGEERRQEKNANSQWGEYKNPLDA